MRERIYITVSDINKTRHFTINQLIKKIFVYFLALIAGVVLILGLTIVILEKKVDEYAFFKEENIKLNSEIDGLNKDIEGLNDEIETKEFALSDAALKLDEIERIVLGKNNIDFVDATPVEKMEEVKLTLSEMSKLLMIVPNGQPLEKVKYTSLYGSRQHPTLGEAAFHWGIDYSAAIGTPVSATSSGVIEYAGVSGAYGKMVIVDHGYGFKTIYAHLSELLVEVGNFVNRTQVIAKSGNTGRSTGPHLHYEVHYLGKRLNPKNFAEWGYKNYESIFQKEGNVKWESLVTMIKREQQQVVKE